MWTLPPDCHPMLRRFTAVCSYSVPLLANIASTAVAAYGKINRCLVGAPAIHRLGGLTLLRHACDVTVRIKLDPVSAFFDGRHALRVSSGCVSRRCDGCFPGTGINTCERD